MNRDAWTKRAAELQLAHAKRIGSAQANHDEWKTREAARWNGNVELASGDGCATHGGPPPGLTVAGRCESGPLITLPWPPTGNTAVRHANGAHYLRPEVTAYRLRVASILVAYEPVRGPYELHVDLSPPDKRNRDIDNALKSLLDACVKGGWLPSDAMSFMRRLLVTVLPDFRGLALVRALPPPKEAA